MVTVNWYLLNDILNPLGGSADNDELVYKYGDVDSNDEARVKGIISCEIKPYYEHSPNAYKDALKRTLAYFLTTDKIDFGRLYDSCLIAFDHPDIAKLFFIWIWEILFPNENYFLDNVEIYKEVEDVNEPRIYWKGTMD